MAEAFSGVMLPMLAGLLPDQGPSFERFLVYARTAAERGS
jgi:hypothetical protein